MVHNGGVMAAPAFPARVLHARLPLEPWADPMTARLPGLQPLGDAPWLIRDEAFAGQMALRDHLIETRTGDVIAALPGTEAAQRELLAAVLDAVAADPGYTTQDGTITRPDGTVLPLNPTQDTANTTLRHTPLALAGRLAQEDFCLLQGDEGGHVLVAACVCFPASWTLAQKIGRPLLAIHDPVARYDAGLNARIEKILSNIKEENPMWRANWLRYNASALHHPLPEFTHRPFDPALETFVRVERQTLRRLPETGAVVFGIHTYLVARSALAPHQAEALELA